jgi:hypothetical protein
MFPVDHTVAPIDPIDYRVRNISIYQDPDTFASDVLPVGLSLGCFRNRLSPGPGPDPRPGLGLVDYRHAARCHCSGLGCTAGRDGSPVGSRDRRETERLCAV